MQTSRPEVSGLQHFCEIHDFAFVWGDLQRGQNIIDTRPTGWSACWSAVKTPLQDVESRPARHMRALMGNQRREWEFVWFESSMLLTGLVRFPHLYALSLSAGEGRLHHAVVLSQHPRSVNELDVVSAGTGEVVRAQTISFSGLRDSSGVIDVEDNVAFTHVKVPRDDGRYVCNLYQHLKMNKGVYLYFIMHNTQRCAPFRTQPGIWNFNCRKTFKLEFT